MSTAQNNAAAAPNPLPVAPAASATPTVTLAQGGLPVAAQAQAGHAPNATPNAVVGAMQPQQALNNVVAPPAQAIQPPGNNTNPGQPHTVTNSPLHEFVEPHWNAQSE